MIFVILSRPVSMILFYQIKVKIQNREIPFNNKIADEFKVIRHVSGSRIEFVKIKDTEMFLHFCGNWFYHAI